MATVDLAVLIDEISILYDVCHSNLPETYEISDIRIFQSMDTNLCEKYLYISDDFSKLSKGQKTSIIFLVVSKTVDIPSNFPLSVISIKTDNSLENVMTVIQEILESYREWKEKCLQSIAGGETLNYTLEIAAEKLQNPIALFDSSLTLIHWTGTFETDISGTIWEMVLKLGYSPLEIYSQREQKKISEIFKSGSMFLTYVADYDEKHTHVVAPIYINDIMFGMLALIDLNNPISSGQKCIIKYIQKTIEAALKLGGKYFNISENSTYFLDRLIRGFGVEKRIIQYYLNNYKWNICDPYYVLNFHSSEQEDPLILQYHSRRIRDKLPKAIIFQFEGSIIAINREIDSPLNKDFFAMLKSMASKMSLKCGISSIFYNFENLKYYYIQSKIALTFVNDNQNLVIHFHEYYISHIIDTLEKATSLKSLCHPRILQLWEENDEQSDILINNLKTYLIYGKNITDTAMALHIHRNTLIYRLNKLQSLFGIDFKDISLNEIEYLKFSCMLVDHLKQ